MTVETDEPQSHFLVELSDSLENGDDEIFGDLTIWVTTEISDGTAHEYVVPSLIELMKDYANGTEDRSFGDSEYLDQEAERFEAIAATASKIASDLRTKAKEWDAQAELLS